MSSENQIHPTVWSFMAWFAPPPREPQPEPVEQDRQTDDTLEELEMAAD